MRSICRKPEFHFKLKKKNCFCVLPAPRCLQGRRPLSSRRQVDPTGSPRARVDRLMKLAQECGTIKVGELDRICARKSVEESRKKGVFWPLWLDRLARVNLHPPARAFSVLGRSGIRDPLTTTSSSSTRFFLEEAVRLPVFRRQQGSKV